MRNVRSWWRVNVEQQLDRLPINWDTFFLYAWLCHMSLTVLSGGRGA
jgi:hypothetical protein